MELIIVITILAILATIAFMSFQGYSEQTRDSNRLASLKSIEKGLTLFQTKSGGYPETSSGIKITASGTTIGYQGSVGENVVRVINMNQVPLDPVDQTRYVYATNEPKSKYQLMAFMEGEDNLVGYVSPSYAGDQSERTPQSIGDNVGIVLNTDNSIPILSVNVSSGTTNYKVVFGNSDEVTASGNLLSVIQAQRGDKTLAKLDESLVGYWDMETTIQSGSLTMLKDLSKYGNHGTCYNSGTSGNCGTVGPKFVNGEGKTGKAMKFNSENFDYIEISGNSTLENQNMTMIVLLKENYSNVGDWRDIVGYLNGIGSYVWSYNMGINNSGVYMVTQLYGVGNLFFSYASKNQLNLDGLNFIANRINNSTISIFMNGTNYSSNKVDNIDYSHNPRNLYFGNPFNKLHTFDGIIDEVRIYNRALSDSEIKALYNATK